MNKIKETFKELSTHFLYICIGLFFLTPTILLLIKNVKFSDGVLSLIGSIIGGYLTLVGVRWGFTHERKSKFMDKYYVTLVALQEAKAALFVPNALVEQYKSRLEQGDEENKEYLRRLIHSDRENITKALESAQTKFQGELLLEFKNAHDTFLTFYTFTDIVPDDVLDEKDLENAYRNITRKMASRLNVDENSKYPLLENYLALLKYSMSLIDKQEYELKEKYKNFSKLNF
ncbi:MULTISPECIES: hypothetical protein [Priestia]|uniref:hypothetical protein n=1 Tax=Priestia TaxID=2800373 RepID=UPI002E2287E7|nr:hypothetical protein [Priestia megaterium]